MKRAGSSSAFTASRASAWASWKSSTSDVARLTPVRRRETRAGVWLRRVVIGFAGGECFAGWSGR
jgi:hypothetical protein